MELKEESRRDSRVSAITEERLMARKEDIEKNSHQVLIFTWKTSSFLMGIVNAEGKDDIHKHGPHNNTKTVLLFSLKRKILQKCLPVFASEVSRLMGRV